MTRFTPSTALLLVTLCVSSAQDRDAVELLYPQATMDAARGSSVKLSCNANFNTDQCGLLHVFWRKQSVELTDPRKYLTTVNETITDESMRSRQVLTEIFNLAPEDSGQYQCKAICEKNKETAMGHFVWVNVQD